jgi:hypothetical protein
MKYLELLFISSSLGVISTTLVLGLILRSTINWLFNMLTDDDVLLIITSVMWVVFSIMSYFGFRDIGFKDTDGNDYSISRFAFLLSISSIIYILPSVIFYGTNVHPYIIFFNTLDFPANSILLYIYAPQLVISYFNKDCFFAIAVTIILNIPLSIFAYVRGYKLFHQ